MANALFYLLSAAALGFGVRVVTARSPLVSVLSLLGTFVCLAVLYLLLGFQFLAAAQLLVYAGAIMVLFLFVIMLLNLGDPASEESPAAAGKGRAAWAAAVAAGLAAASVLAAGSVEARAADPALEGGLDDLTDIATVLFSRYMLPFEAASLLLLAVMVGVIVLAKRQRGPAGSSSLSLGGEPVPSHEEGAAR